MLLPRESAKFIAEKATLIKIQESGVKALAQEVVTNLKNGSLTISGFSQCEVHPSQADEKAVDWIFVVDTLNFCFWSESSKEKWTVTWQGKQYTGYFALCAAINRALDEGFAITDPKFYSSITLKDLEHIFRGDTELKVPLIKERQECLHQVGLILLEKFEGKFSNCIKSSNNSAIKLLEIISTNFLCYKDEAIYKGKEVAFYKRAQILIGDIWVCFKGKDLGSFTDIDQLTMFADYRIPQVLIHFKCLKYSDALMELLEKDARLKPGSEEEIEIRGCSIHAVELVVKEVRKILSESDSDVNGANEILCNSVLVDHFLWDYRRKHAEKLEYIPFHKTLGIYY